MARDVRGDLLVACISMECCCSVWCRGRGITSHLLFALVAVYLFETLLQRVALRSHHG